MGRVYEEIGEHLADWISRQSMFFVGSAPLSPNGHVNISPKGPIGSLKVLSPRTIAYLDVSGSGAETIAHIRENGRIVVMLCAFEGPPRIVRLHGRGEVVLADAPRFEALLNESDFEDPSVPQARRSIVLVQVDRISDSCGYGVPLMSFEGLREHHELSAAKKIRTLGEDGYASYVLDHNPESIDGLPALDGAGSTARSAKSQLS
jgi:Pyridoxamine 5'-phosphate oxidase